PLLFLSLCVFAATRAVCTTQLRGAVLLILLGLFLQVCDQLVAMFYSFRQAVYHLINLVGSISTQANSKANLADILGDNIFGRRQDNGRQRWQWFGKRVNHAFLSTSSDYC